MLKLELEPTTSISSLDSQTTCNSASHTKRFHLTEDYDFQPSDFSSIVEILARTFTDSAP